MAERKLSPRAMLKKVAREQAKKEKNKVLQAPKRPKLRVGKDINAKRKPKKDWEKHEHDSAKGYSDGVLTPGSGNKHVKGDVDTPLFHQENKLTSKSQYTIKRDIWEKIYREALAVGKTPVYCFKMDGLPSLAIVEERTLQDYHNELLELRKFKREMEKKNGQEH